jgi:bifunctional oligoribonuclease and PAP phosphatase NrnA
LQPLQQIHSILQSSKQKIVITTHQKPDGDAMGSSLGLYHFLINQGHEVQVISPTNWAHFLQWMPGAEKVIDFEKSPEQAIQITQAAQIIFCLDFNTPSRVKKYEEAITQATAIKVLIDHHEQPAEAFFAYGLSLPAKSSTAQMVYDFIASAPKPFFNEAIAQCLYTGIMTDTGSFRFKAADASVHLAIAHLKEIGFDHSLVHEKIYDNFLENRLRFIGNLLLNRMEVFYEYNTALVCIPADDLTRFEITTGDTEGLVNYPLAIQGIKMACLAIDRGEEIKLSFRSKGNVDVNTFARNYFNGGGHFNAAGGSSKETLAQVKKLFKQAIHEQKNLLQ